MSIGITIGLVISNEFKISFLKSPITFLDLQITALDPMGLINALGLSIWPIVMIFLIIFLFGVVLLYTIFQIIKLLLNAKSKIEMRKFIIKAFVFLFIIAYGILFLNQFYNAAQTVAVREDVYRPERFSKLSRYFTIYGFFTIPTGLRKMNQDIILKLNTTKHRYRQVILNR